MSTEPPFAMVQRYGVGNLLRLLCAYGLHRASQGLAHAAERTIVKTGVFATSRLEMPSARHGDHRDGLAESHRVNPPAWLHDAPQPRSEVALVAPNQTHSAPTPQRARPNDVVPAEPEPWYRALQVAHRSPSALEEKRVPAIDDHLPERNEVDEVLQAPKPEPSHKEDERFKTEGREVLQQEETPRYQPAVDAAIASETNPSGHPEEKRIPPPKPGEETLVRAKNVSRKAMELAPGTHLEEAEESTLPLHRATMKHLRTLDQASLASVPKESITPDHWPLLPPESPPSPQPQGRPVDVVQSPYPPRHQRKRSEERTPQTGPILSTHPGSTEWPDLHTMWPSLPEEPGFAQSERDLERYQREQRRWNEQRGIL